MNQTMEITLPMGVLGLELEPVLRNGKSSVGCRVRSWQTAKKPKVPLLTPGSVLMAVDGKSVEKKLFKDIVNWLKTSNMRHVRFIPEGSENYHPNSPRTPDRASKTMKRAATDSKATKHSNVSLSSPKIVGELRENLFGNSPTKSDQVESSRSQFSPIEEGEEAEEEESGQQEERTIESNTQHLEEDALCDHEASTEAVSAVDEASIEALSVVDEETSVITTGTAESPTMMLSTGALRTASPAALIRGFATMACATSSSSSSSSSSSCEGFQTGMDVLSAVASQLDAMPQQEAIEPGSSSSGRGESDMQVEHLREEVRSLKNSHLGKDGRLTLLKFQVRKLRREKRSSVPKKTSTVATSPGSGPVPTPTSAAKAACEPSQTCETGVATEVHSEDVGSVSVVSTGAQEPATGLVASRPTYDQLKHQLAASQRLNERLRQQMHEWVDSQIDVHAALANKEVQYTYAPPIFDVDEDETMSLSILSAAVSETDGDGGIALLDDTMLTNCPGTPTTLASEGTMEAWSGEPSSRTAERNIGAAYTLEGFPPINEGDEDHPESVGEPEPEPEEEQEQEQEQEREQEQEQADENELAIRLGLTCDSSSYQDSASGLDTEDDEDAWSAAASPPPEPRHPQESTSTPDAFESERVLSNEKVPVPSPATTAQFEQVPSFAVGSSMSTMALSTTSTATSSPDTVRTAWKAWGVMERLERRADEASPASSMSPASFRDHIARIKCQNASIRDELSRFRSNMKTVRAAIV